MLKHHGIRPAPERPTSWRTFLASHADVIAGADFFTTEVWTARRLVTHYTLFVIDIATRTVHVAGTTTNPDDACMAQVARNLTDCVDGFLRNKHFLIIDRHTKYVAEDGWLERRCTDPHRRVRWRSVGTRCGLPGGRRRR